MVREGSARMKAGIYIGLLVIAGVAVSAPSQSYLDGWKRICSKSENRDKYVECWRPPGDYQAVYQMTGEKKRRAMEQGKKVLDMRSSTDKHMGRYRR